MVIGASACCAQNLNLLIAWWGARYLYDLQDELDDVAAAVKRGTYGPLWQFVKNRKGLFAATLLPLLIIFRMSSLALGALAVVPRCSFTLITHVCALRPCYFPSKVFVALPG